MSVMKKFVLALAVLALTGLNGIASIAFDALNSFTAFEQSEAYQERDGFKEINLDQLPEAVKEAAKKDQPDLTVVSAEEKIMPNGEKIYRIMFKSQEKGLFTKTFHADGEEFKEEKKEG